MAKEAKKYFEDIVLNIEEINQFMVEIDSFITYTKNNMVIKAVERNLEILGEIVKRLKNIDIVLPSSHLIIAFRNHLALEYDKIDDSLVYNIVIRHLPKLYQEVKTLMNDH